MRALLGNATGWLLAMVAVVGCGSDDVEDVGPEPTILSEAIDGDPVVGGGSAYYPYDYSIMRVPVGGGAANAFTGLAGTAMTTDGSALYWTDGDAVHRQPLSGSDATMMVDASSDSATAVSVDDAWLYVQYRDRSSKPEPPPEIRIFSKDATQPQPPQGTVLTSCSYSCPMAASGGLLFHASASSVHRVTNTGAGYEEQALAEGRSHIQAITADANAVFWTEETTGEPLRVMRVATDGTGLTQIAAIDCGGSGETTGIASDERHVYFAAWWAGDSDDCVGQEAVLRVPLTGGDVEVVTSRKGQAPLGAIALGDSEVVFRTASIDEPSRLLMVPK